MAVHQFSPSDPEYQRERITQLEWEIDKLMEDKPKFGIKFEKLREPFLVADLEWRVQQSGGGSKGPWAKIVPYVNARMIIDRLDSVCGPENWQDSYEELKDGFLCTLLINGPFGWIAKSDGAPNTEIEGTKGGISDAFKRAAVKWGIGRYLYNFPVVWAQIFRESEDGHYAKLKDGTIFYWKPPKEYL